jgi:hypothetical protein
MNGLLEYMTPDTAAGELIAIVGWLLTVITEAFPETASPFTFAAAVRVQVVPMLLGRVHWIAPKLPLEFVDREPLPM